MPWTGAPGPEAVLTYAPFAGILPFADQRSGSAPHRPYAWRPDRL